MPKTTTDSDGRSSVAGAPSAPGPNQPSAGALGRPSGPPHPGVTSPATHPPPGTASMTGPAVPLGQSLARPPGSGAIAPAGQPAVGQGSTGSEPPTGEAPEPAAEARQRVRDACAAIGSLVRQSTAAPAGGRTRSSAPPGTATSSSGRFASASTPPQTATASPLPRTTSRSSLPRAASTSPPPQTATASPLPRTTSSSSLPRAASASPLKAAAASTVPHAVAGSSSLPSALRRSDTPPRENRTTDGVLEVSDDDWLPDGALEDSPEPVAAPVVISSHGGRAQSASPPLITRKQVQAPDPSDSSIARPAPAVHDRNGDAPRVVPEPAVPGVDAAHSPARVDDAPLEAPTAALAPVVEAASPMAAEAIPIVASATTAEGQSPALGSATDPSPVPVAASTAATDDQSAAARSPMAADAIPVPTAPIDHESPIETATPDATAVAVTANTPQRDEIPVELSVTDADPVPIETAAVEEDEIPVSLGEPVPGSRAGSLPGYVGIAAKPPTPPLSSGSPLGVFSIEPTVKDVDESPPGARRFRMSASHWVAIGGAAALLAAVLVLVRSANGDGALLVTASQSTGAAPSRVRLLVDGEQRCDRLPCRVDGLTAGSHQLRAESDQRAELANIEIQIRAGSETSVPLLLLPPAATEARPSQAAAQVQPEDAATAPDAESDVQREARSTRSRPHARRGARPARAATEAARQSAKDTTGPAAATASTRKPEPAAEGIGKLMVTSEPSGMVIVDGQQRGWTPRTLQLPAGPHSVTVQHPEYGEQSSDVMIKAGASTMLRVDL